MTSLWFFFFKEKTAYDMRISDWSSDVCSSDLGGARAGFRFGRAPQRKLEIAAVAHHHFSVALTCRDRGLSYRHGRDRRGGASARRGLRPCGADQFRFRHAGGGIGTAAVREISCLVQGEIGRAHV